MAETTNGVLVYALLGIKEQVRGVSIYSDTGERIGSTSLTPDDIVVDVSQETGPVFRLSGGREISVSVPDVDGGVTIAEARLLFNTHSTDLPEESRIKEYVKPLQNGDYYEDGGKMVFLDWEVGIDDEEV